MATANNSLAASSAAKPKFSNFLTQAGVRAMIKNTIQDSKGFISSITSAVGANPALAECEHSSILSAALLGASLKLSPSPQLGQYYMVPYKDKHSGTKKAQFQLGYKGYIQLAVRSGYYKRLNVLAIKQGEFKSYNPLEETVDVELIADEAAREAAPTIGYYAMFEYHNGFRKTLYWSKEKMEVHADKYSPAFKLADYKRLKAGKIPAAEMWKYSSFWYKDFDAMALKTMLRQIISKWGIMSIDLQKAYEADDHAVNSAGEPEVLEAEVIKNKMEETQTAMHAEVSQLEQDSRPVEEPAAEDDPLA